MNKEEFANLYDKFREKLASTPAEGTLVNYGWGNFPSSISPLWMAYGFMFQEFSREAANSINQLVNYTHRLKVWQEILKSLNEDQIFEVLNEFIEAMATTSLNLPYVIRSRLIFTATHLAHQANRALEGETWKDDLPLDKEIFFSTADKYCNRWNSYKDLKRKLERISAKDYQDATLDFRHKYNHRFSPRVAVGYILSVTRSVDPTTGRLSYGFGETPPLSLDLIVSLLNVQCTRCYDAFQTYKLFIQEHEAALGWQAKP